MGGSKRDDLTQRVKETLGQDTDAIRQADALNNLCAAYGDELRSLSPLHQSVSIKAAARHGPTQAPGAPGCRARSLTEARSRGVDLDELRALQRSGRERVGALLHAAASFSSGELTVRALDPPFDWPITVLPLPAVSTVLQPPFAEGWDRTSINEVTGDGTVPVFDSYLDAHWGRLGTRVVARNLDTSDNDWLNLFHQCGFIVPFTMPHTSALQVTVDLTCLVCEHKVSTSDEWGWSDFYASTQSGVKFEVLWERDDGHPMAESFRQRFVQGLEAAGDGESSPGMKVMVGPGERRSVNFITDVAFPANKLVWIYLGMSDFLFAKVNDVSITISMDSAWQLASLTISAL